MFSPTFFDHLIKKIYYKKRRSESYRTFTLHDSLIKSQTFFPKNIPYLPVQKNVEMLNVYRDYAIHFYNEDDFRSIIYALAQASVRNYVDIIKEVFGIKFSDDISWNILPLGIKPSIDPVEYLKKDYGKKNKNQAVKEFLEDLRGAAKEIQQSNIDTERLLTVYNIKFESVKKIEKADFVVGVKSSSQEGRILVNKFINPNESHPYRQKYIIEKINNIYGIRFTPYVFQSILKKYDLKNNPKLTWVADEGVLVKYSNEIIAWILRLSKNDIEQAIKEYKEGLKTKKEKVIKNKT